MEIPVLLYIRNVGTHDESVSRKRESRCKRRRCWVGKSVQQANGVMRSEVKVAKHADVVPRKAAIVYTIPVP